MSKKPKNRNKKHHQRRAQNGRELEELITACNTCLDVGYVSFNNLVKLYVEGNYRTHVEAAKLVPVEDYIKSAQVDLKSLEVELTKLSLNARTTIKNYVSPEENIVASIDLHQQFEDWTTSYQTSITPTLLELSSYLDTLNPSNPIVETPHE